MCIQTFFFSFDRIYNTILCTLVTLSAQKKDNNSYNNNKMINDLRHTQCNLLLTHKNGIYSLGAPDLIFQRLKSHQTKPAIDGPTIQGGSLHINGGVSIIQFIDGPLFFFAYSRVALPIDVSHEKKKIKKKIEHGWMGGPH